MSYRKATLLIVDDDKALVQTLSAVLTGSGYQVRCAVDGFSALAELRNEVPDIILSDLNMPGMSGFELLSVVRRRFPLVHVIAMSAAFSGDAVPRGVAAEAFYEKGSNLAALLRAVDSAAKPNPPPNASAPIWLPRRTHDPSGKPNVVLTCMECLRTFAQLLGELTTVVHETSCLYCNSLIHYAIVEPEPTAPKVIQLPLPLSPQGELASVLNDSSMDFG